MTLSDRISGLDSSPIRKAFQLATTIKDPINLSIGQPHFSCPENITEAVCKAARDGKTSYTLTEGIPELKEALMSKYAEFNKIGYVKPERLLITSGVSSALMLLFNVMVNPGDDCLVLEPYFLMYPSMLKFQGANVSTLKESFTSDDISNLKNRKFKLIIYSNPSNPSGYIFSREQLELLAELAEQTGAYLISDEIYEYFDYDKKFISIGSFYEKAITLSGFSKTYSMTGLRLASIIAPLEIHQAIATLQQYTVVCAPSVVQWAGIEALRTDMSTQINDYKTKRDLFFNELRDSYEISKTPGAFYYFIKINSNDEEFAAKAFAEKKLIIVPGYIFNQSHKYIRVSFAASDSILEKGIKALKELS